MTETQKQKRVLLVVLDGFGEAENDPRPKGNAIALAKTPNLDRMRKEHPFSLLEACGEAVGLVEGGMGGSEIGHFAIGAGRVVPQSLLQINRSIKDKSFFQNEAICRAFDHVAKKSSERSLHLLGMISDAGVHSHMDHLFALISKVDKQNIKKCFIHCIADGRDVEPQSVVKYIEQIHAKIKELDLEENVFIGSLIGRFYAMDRDQNWERTETAYKLLTNLEGEKLESDEISYLKERIKEFYSSDEKEKSDYYIPPIVANKNAKIKENDAVIFFNFRTDRPRQLTEAFEQEPFEQFKHNVSPSKLIFITFGPYSETHTDDRVTVAFPTETVKNNLGCWLTAKQIPQLRVAETEKYAHVTYFFNSQSDEVYKDEDRILVPSKKCNNFSELPEMSASEITDKIVEAMKNKKHDVIISNYANADLVGHTGKLNPTIKAVEVLDECLGRLEKSAKEEDFILIITGDHGNAEDMTYDDGSEKMSHSMNRVIFMVANYKQSKLKLNDGGLADVAPTLLELIGVDQPTDMTGKSLIVS